MIFVETAMLTTLLVLLMISGYTDCRSSIIPNRLLLVGCAIALLADVIYYSAWGQEYIGDFFINLALLTMISAVFYCYHLWAAGDSKLLFVVALLIPGRFYSFWDIGPASGFSIVVFTFSIAFLYVIFESVWLLFKNHVRIRLTVPNMDWWRILASYVSMVAATMLFNYMLQFALGPFVANNQLLLTAIDFLAVLTLIQLRDRLSTRWLMAAAIILWGGLFALQAIGLAKLGGVVNIRSWLVILAMLLCRWIAERFNYRVIPTSEVKAGQILSAATIASFAPSRIRGLPSGMTEDLRSRLTEDEAESVRRWASSAHGRETVVIVRKIPFAMFIGIGTLCFFAFEVAMI